VLQSTSEFPEYFLCLSTLDLLCVIPFVLVERGMWCRCCDAWFFIGDVAAVRICPSFQGTRWTLSLSLIPLMRLPISSWVMELRSLYRRLILS